MKTRKRVLSCATGGWLLLGWPAAMQGAPFINLGFESAMLPTIAAGLPGELVPVEQAFPGWRVFLGVEEQTQVWHNSLALGSSQAGILGPEFGFGRIEGTYTAVLQAGTDRFGAAQTVSLSQRASLPPDAGLLQFQALGRVEDIGGLNPLLVTLDGRPVEMVPLSGAPPYYTLFAGDVSTFSGLTAELRITAVPFTEFGYSFSLDSIQFLVPEPSPVPSQDTCGGSYLDNRGDFGQAIPMGL